MPASPEKLPLASMDVAADKRRLLKRLFPEAFTESTGADGQPAELDFEKLKAVLGEHVAIADPQAEKYGLDWPGKRDALKAVQTPALGTLVPCPEESVDWETTKNVFIEGDNLEVLKLLQKAYYGKVKMIYIDPPYNTGNDFVYPDNYAESLDTYLRYTGQVSGEGVKLTTNSKDSGRFHSNWLRMMYPRLYVAKNLLREDGVIFISIGQDETSNLRSICDQLFGEDNFVSICSRVMKTGGQKGAYFSPCVDYILVYAKNIEELANFREPISENVIENVYTKVEASGPKVGEKYRTMGLYQAMLDKRANQRFWISCPDGTLAIPPGESFPYELTEGAQVTPGDGDGVWRWTYGRYKEEKAKDNIEFIKSETTSLVRPDGKRSEWNINYKIWLQDRLNDGQLPGNILTKFESRHSSAELKKLGIPFDFAKPSNLIAFLAGISGVAKDDLVMDFFAGSGSTAHGLHRLFEETGTQCRFICVQLPEPTAEDSSERKAGYKTIADIAKERIRRAGAKIRAEWEAKHGSREAAKARSEEKQAGDLFSASTGDSSSSHPTSTISDPPSLPPDTGFRVFKLAPSNFKRWDGGAAAESVEALERQLEANLDHLAAEATEESILFEILLKAGFELTCPVEKHELAGLPVHSVEDGALLLCLADRVTPALIDAVAERHPVQFICLDRALHGDDALKVNALETFRACQPEIQFRTV